MGNMDPFVLYQPHFLRIHLKSCVHHDSLVLIGFLHQPEVLSFIMQCIMPCWYAVCKTNKKVVNMEILAIQSFLRTP